MSKSRYYTTLGKDFFTERELEKAEDVHYGVYLPDVNKQSIAPEVLTLLRLNLQDVLQLDKISEYNLEDWYTRAFKLRQPIKDNLGVTLKEKTPVITGVRHILKHLGYKLEKDAKVRRPDGKREQFYKIIENWEFTNDVLNLWYERDTKRRSEGFYNHYRYNPQSIDDAKLTEIFDEVYDFGLEHPDLVLEVGSRVIAQNGKRGVVKVSINGACMVLWDGEKKETLVFSSELAKVE